MEMQHKQLYNNAGTPKQPHTKHQEKAHKETWRPISRKPTTCPYCGEKYSNGELILQHLDIRRNNYTRPTGTCSLLPAKTQTPEIWKQLHEKQNKQSPTPQITIPLQTLPNTTQKAIQNQPANEEKTIEHETDTRRTKNNTQTSTPITVHTKENQRNAPARTKRKHPTNPDKTTTKRHKTNTPNTQIAQQNTKLTPDPRRTNTTKTASPKTQSHKQPTKPESYDHERKHITKKRKITLPQETNTKKNKPVNADMVSIAPCNIFFHDPLGQHWQEMQEHETDKHAQKYPLNPEPYIHPNDTNTLIYPEQRNREPWAEKYTLNWFGPKPTPKTLQKENMLPETLHGPK